METRGTQHARTEGPRGPGTSTSSQGLPRAWGAGAAPAPGPPAAHDPGQAPSRPAAVRPSPAAPHAARPWPVPLHRPSAPRASLPAQPGRSRLPPAGALAEPPKNPQEGGGEKELRKKPSSPGRPRPRFPAIPGRSANRTRARAAAPPSAGRTANFGGAGGGIMAAGRPARDTTTPPPHTHTHPRRARGLGHRASRGAPGRGGQREPPTWRHLGRARPALTHRR